MPAHKRRKNKSHKLASGKQKSFASKKLGEDFFKVLRIVLYGFVGLFVVGVLLLAIASAWFWSQRHWNGQNRVSVLMIEESGNVRLYSYEKDNAVVLHLGSEVMVKTVHGYGEYKLGVLSKLGKQDGYGYELLVKTVETWLGVNLLGVISVKEFPEEDVTKKVWQDFRNKLILAMDGTVALGDRWYLWFESRELGSGDVYYLDLTGSAVYSKTRLADGAEVFNPDDNKLKNLIGLRLYDSFVVARPDMPVAIVNTTGESGLARGASSLLSGVGYDVVSVIDQTEELSKTEILVDESVDTEEHKYFLSPVEIYFNVRAKEEVGLLGKYRSRVVVKLGRDYLELLEEK